MRYEARVYCRTGVWPFRRRRWRVWDVQRGGWVTYAPGIGQLSALLVARGMNNGEAGDTPRSP